MSRDFMHELKERLRRLDGSREVPIVPVDRVIKRYNIHKRSLPVGIDKIVLFSVTKNEGEWWVESKLQSKVYQDEHEDSKTVIYYDLVPVDATPKEKSVFFNKSPVTTEETCLKSPYRIN